MGAYVRKYPPRVTPGRRPASATLLALLLAAPFPGLAQVLDFDGVASPSAAGALPLPLPFIPAPRPPVPRKPAAAPVPSVSFKGRRFKALQFSRAERAPETIAATLDLTRRSALLALYELKLPAAADAIIRAHRRGVEVKLVFDEGHAKVQPGAEGRSAELQRVIDAGVPVRLLKGGGSYGIMHHKTAVLDGELLLAGSFNWTAAADERNYENLVLRDDPAVVALYAQDWRWMWDMAHEPEAEGAAAAPGAPPADSAKPVRFNGGSYPRAAFSPQGGVEALLLDAVGRARSRIEVAIFSFYSDALARALVEAARRGVAVRVVADAGQARRSPAVRALREGGIELRLAEGRAGGYSVMHHKFMVLDGTLAVNGSFNYSKNAELYNHENILFSVEPGEAAALAAEQAFVFSQGRVPTAEDLPPLQ